MVQRYAHRAPRTATGGGLMSVKLEIFGMVLQTGSQEIAIARMKLILTVPQARNARTEIQRQLTEIETAVGS